MLDGSFPIAMQSYPAARMHVGQALDGAMELLSAAAECMPSGPHLSQSRFIYS